MRRRIQDGITAVCRPGRLYRCRGKKPATATDQAERARRLENLRWRVRDNLLT